MSAIGFFDSGLGGLSVLRHALTRLPQADFLYVADSAHAPYGDKEHSWVSDRSLFIARWLQCQGAEALVIACNTATALAAERIREQLAIPVIAMEPAVKPAAAGSESGRVAVLATATTLASRRYADLRKRHAGGIELYEVAPHHWIEAIESGRHLQPGFLDQIAEDLAPLRDQGVDTWVLACTHFPIVIDQLRSVLWETARVIDPGAAVSEELARRLGCPPQAGTAADDRGKLSLFSSGNPAVLAEFASAYLAWGKLSAESFRESATA